MTAIIFNRRINFCTVGDNNLHSTKPTLYGVSVKLTDFSKLLRIHTSSHVMNTPDVNLTTLGAKGFISSEGWVHCNGLELLLTLSPTG